MIRFVQHYTLDGAIKEGVLLVVYYKSEKWNIHVLVYLIFETFFDIKKVKQKTKWSKVEQTLRTL